MHLGEADVSSGALDLHWLASVRDATLHLCVSHVECACAVGDDVMSCLSATHGA
jgi:hypothetical protein